MTRKNLSKKNTSLDYLSYSVITEIEEKYPVYDLEFKDGSKIWNPLRIYLYFYILETELRSKDIFYKKIFNMFLEGLKPVKIPNKTYTFCAFTSGRNRRYKFNKYYDIMMDPIQELINKPMFICEWPGPDGKHRKYDKDIFSDHASKVHISIYDKAFWQIFFNRINIKSLYFTSENIYTDILEYYAKHANVDFGRLISDSYNYLSSIPVMKEYFHAFLEKIQPSIVFMVGGHSGFNMALIQACKEQEIKTIELQHGLITKYHAAYMKDKKSTYYDYRPDYIFTYGSYFTEMIQNKYAFPKSHVRTIGYPYLNRVKKIPPKISINVQQHLKNYKNNILITSQWNIADEITSFTNALAANLEKRQKKTGIIFKPHPSDWRNYKTQISKSNICIVSKFEDTYDLFKISDIHSTIYSTSGFEALSFSKPNIFIDIGKTSMSDLSNIIDNETCYEIKNIEEYINVLNHIMKNIKSISRKAYEKSIQYFYPDSENILNRNINNLNFSDK